MNKNTNTNTKMISAQHMKSLRKKARIGKKPMKCVKSIHSYQSNMGGLNPALLKY
jgi:hypothetical protein